MRHNEESFFRFALRMSAAHKQYFLELHSPNESRQDEFAAEAEASLAEQSRIEASDKLSFDEYLSRYFAG
jgi:glutamate--cysteine ligase